MKGFSLSLRPSRTGASLVVMIALALLAGWLLFWKLGLKPLENWDEGIHAEVSREMWRSGEWVSMSYRDALYTAKPPLKFWLAAPLFSMFGETELAVRFWSALAGVATTMLLAWWAWRWSNSVRLAFLAGALFISGRFVMFHAFRTGETDGLLVLLITAAFYAYWKSWEQQRWFWLFGVLVGLAFMTKSFAGLIPVLVAAIDLTLGKRWSSLGIRTVMQSAALALIIALPWHAVELLRHGRAFWDSYFGFHVLERVSDVLYANNVPWYWYVEIVVKRMFPFSLFLPAAILLAVRRAFKDRDRLDRLLLIWVAVVFGLFTLARTKFDWYILPIYPALGLLLARSISEFLHRAEQRWMAVGALISLAAAWYAMPFGLAPAGILWKLTPYAYVSTVADSLTGRIVVALVATGLVALLALALRRSTLQQPNRAVGIAVTAYLLLLTLGWQVSYLRHLPTSSPLKTISQKVDELDARQLDVIGIDLLRQPAGYFYLRRVPGLAVREVQSPSRLESDLTLTTTDPQYASVRARGNAILQRGKFILIERREPLPE